ncbi:SSI family serine proteinase inhibitor [Nonomuraea candida]|uniref:SSI family serine proteinase inhibitor n=1 Tax=Nonomuraea candida TaxID=359159 RepID=UPI0005BA9813|nr:SSI family serine proteinase inhibitor [Nonomuraea candida]
MIKAAGTLALCGALLLGGSTPTLAAPHPKARLKIVDGVKGGPVKSVWLHCGPVGGTHPHAQAACRLLKQVKGQPAKLNVTPKASCSQEIQPHAVIIGGQWYGTKVRWAKFFPNACYMKAMGGQLLSL